MFPNISIEMITKCWQANPGKDWCLLERHSNPMAWSDLTLRPVSPHIALGDIRQVRLHPSKLQHVHIRVPGTSVWGCLVPVTHCLGWLGGEVSPGIQTFLFWICWTKTCIVWQVFVQVVGGNGDTKKRFKACKIQKYSPKFTQIHVWKKNVQNDGPSSDTQTILPL